MAEENKITQDHGSTPHLLATSVSSSETINSRYKEDLLRKIRNNRVYGTSAVRWASLPPVPIKTAVKKRREEIENEGLEQDIRLKRHTLYALFGFLIVETGLIFYFSYLQGMEVTTLFHLEEWSFRLLVAATISQITFMLHVAVKHLFPHSTADKR